MQPLALCVHMEKSRVMRLSFLAMPLGIVLREVPESDWGQPIAALCGLEPRKSRAPAVQVPGEMMVMAHFPDALMDRWLLAIRQSGLAAVRLKAVLTPFNRGWHCGRLYAMLSQEAAAFAAAKEAGHETPDHGL